MVCWTHCHFFSCVTEISLVAFWPFQEYHSDTLESRTSTDVSKEWAVSCASVLIPRVIFRFDTCLRVLTCSAHIMKNISGSWRGKFWSEWHFTWWNFIRSISSPAFYISTSLLTIVKQQNFVKLWGLYW